MRRTVLSTKDVQLIISLSQQKKGTVLLPHLEAMGLEAEPEEKIRQLEPDDYKSRLLKYIPAEVVALYLTIDALLRSSKPTASFGFWVAFIVGLVGVPSYLWRVQRVRKRKQLVISTVAFVVWVLAIGGPFEFLRWYDPIIGAVVLIVYTFAIPIIEG